MATGTESQHAATGSTASVRAVPERRVFFALASLAVAATVVAVLVNYVQVRGSLFEPATGTSTAAYAPSVQQVSLSRSPKSLLPGDILGFEAMAVQAVPGQTNTAAEALYVTTDMKLDMQVSTGSYARVEGFATSKEAVDRVAEIMKSFPDAQKDITLNKTIPARSGFSTDRGSWGAAWASGQYAMTVKTYFKDAIPKQDNHFLDHQGLMVASAVEVFDRTGKQGIEAQRITDAPLPGSLSTSSGIGTLPQLGSP